MRLCGLLILAAIVPCGPARAATIVVPDSVSTIAAALAAAVAADTVLVRSGTYPENVVMVDGVILRGENPADRPVLDGGATGIALTASGCGASTRIEDFVITNGLGTGLGGGAHVFQSSLVFQRCRFVQNAAALGGAIGSDESAFLAVDCEFEANVATQSGGAISMTDLPGPTLESCLFLGNDAQVGGAVAVRNGCTPLIRTCLFEGNLAEHGAGLWFDLLTGGEVTECTFVRQEATMAGGGALYFNALAIPLIDRTVVALGVAGGAMFVAVGADPIVGCSDFFGNVGGESLAGAVDLGTNLFADPLFCDPALSDWSIRSDSPCADDGACGRRGAFDVACVPTAIGAELETSTWARVKAGWRR
ncbi:MAG: hypothetical protein R3B81_05810 [bacterium]